jgi:glycerophosphoryl diester phosphodiesterase
MRFSGRNGWFGRSSPLIIGHRGASAAAPENTLAAFRLAQQQGADGIEFDVQLSADGVPVVIHDDTVERTTNGRGRVSDLTLAQLQTLDAGQGESIPTLAQVFAEFGTDFLYNLEIKNDHQTDQGAEKAIAACIRQYGIQAQLLISSFNPAALERIHALLGDEVPLGFLHMGMIDRYAPDWLFPCHTDHPYHEAVDAAYMAWAKEHGYQVNIWTLDDATMARQLINLGVQGLITNTPDWLRQNL